MFKKAFNKGGKRVLSFVMAAALAASSLPTLPQFTAEAALGDVGTKPAHMGQTSYNILNAFGELNNNGTTYDSLYTGIQMFISPREICVASTQSFIVTDTTSLWIRTLISRK